MGMNVKYLWVGRGRCTDVGAILCHSRVGDLPIWVRDVGGDPPYGANLGGFPPQRGLEPHRKSTTTPHGWGLV